MNPENEESKINSFFNIGGNTTAPKKTLQPRSQTSQAVQTQESQTSSRLEEYAPTESKPLKEESVTIQEEKKVQNFTASQIPSRSSLEESAGMEYVGPIRNELERKTYPNRVYDSYAKKDARLVKNDLDLIQAWADRITENKRKLGLNKASVNRITDNSILRIMLSVFCDKASLVIQQPGYTEVTNEAELEAMIQKIMLTKVPNNQI